MSTSRLMRSYYQAAAPDRHVISYELNDFEDTIRQVSVEGFIPTADMPFYGLFSRDGQIKDRKLPVYCTEPIQCRDGYLRTQRRIVSAANRFRLKDGTVLVIPSARHGSAGMHATCDYLVAMGLFDDKKWPMGSDQGFIDNFDNYWSRKEAMLIAKHANQVNFETNGGDNGELYSEGLY